MYVMTPILHMSTAVPYFLPFSTSGPTASRHMLVVHLPGESRFRSLQWSSKATGPVCVRLCVRTITFELNDLWPRYVEWWWFISILSRSCLKVKVTQIKVYGRAMKSVADAHVRTETCRPIWLSVEYFVLNWWSVRPLVTDF